MARLMVVASSSAATGSEAAAIQSSAVTASSGGVKLRVPGLNAHANSALRSTAGSGAPRRSRTSATVMVVSASATDRRGDRRQVYYW
jgi:hypothetical protein